MFATGGLDLPAGANKTRQLKHANDSLIIALREYKKIGFMTGSELARQNPKGRLLPEDARRLIESELTKIDDDFAAFHKELERLTKEGDDSLRADLLEMHALSGGKVFTYDDMTQFMRVLSKGGRFKGQNYKSGIREQISPTILAVATLLVLLSIILLTVIELLRRRSERLRGVTPS